MIYLKEQNLQHMELTIRKPKFYDSKTLYQRVTYRGHVAFYHYYKWPEVDNMQARKMKLEKGKNWLEDSFNFVYANT